jgi:MATE family multidrug resistance protein
MHSKVQTWWSREAGGREVFRLALPLVLSTASWAIMNFVDRLLLFWHSSTEMAAALPSGNLLWTVMGLPLGIASYVNTFVAQYHGAHQPRRIGVVVRHGIMFGWFVTPLFLLLIPLAPYLFQWIGHTELAREETIYFQINCFGIGTAVTSAAYASFYTGQGKTAIVMWIDIIASLMNVVLDWLWIFGKLGFPEMGIAGAAAGTVVSQWFKIVVYWWLVRRPDVRATFGFDEKRWFDLSLFRRLLRFGTPNGLQMQLEGLAFTVFLIGIGQLGTVAAAATTLAISINIVAFVPMMGAGIAVSTLVGNYLGANRPDLARRATWSGLWMALAYNAVFAVLYLGVPHWFMLMHQFGAPDKDFDTIKSLSVVLLRFVAAYCLFDATQLMFCSAVKGAGDTRFVLWTTVVTSAMAVILGQAGVWWLGWGLLWWWTVLMLWILALAAAYGVRFWQGKWERMRVIEQTPAAAPVAITLRHDEPLHPDRHLA